MKLKIFFYIFISTFFINIVEAQNRDQNNRDAFFAYGEKKYNEFIANNQIIPRAAQMYGIDANVILKTAIDEKGFIDSVWVDKCIPDTAGNLPVIARDQFAQTLIEFENEAIRLLKLTSGLWNYATKDQKPVKDTLLLEITFRTKQFQKNYANKHKKYFRNWSYDVQFTDLMDPQRMISFGKLELEQKKYYFAEKYFEEAVRYDPLSAESHYYLGVARLYVNKRNLACESWNRAKELGYEGEYLGNYCD